MLSKVISWNFQGLLRVQGRPAVSYDEQGMVFAVAYGGHIRMFDARKFEKVVVTECVVLLLVQPYNLLLPQGPFEIFSVGNDDAEAHVIKFSTDGRRILLTTKAGRVHVLDSFHGSSVSMQPTSVHILHARTSKMWLLQFFSFRLPRTM